MTERYSEGLHNMEGFYSKEGRISKGSKKKERRKKMSVHWRKVKIQVMTASHWLSCSIFH